MESTRDTKHEILHPLAVVLRAHGWACLPPDAVLHAWGQPEEAPDLNPVLATEARCYLRDGLVAGLDGHGITRAGVMVFGVQHGLGTADSGGMGQTEGAAPYIEDPQLDVHA